MCLKSALLGALQEVENLKRMASEKDQEIENFKAKAKKARQCYDMVMKCMELLKKRG